VVVVVVVDVVFISGIVVFVVFPVVVVVVVVIDLNTSGIAVVKFVACGSAIRPIGSFANAIPIRKRHHPPFRLLLRSLSRKRPRPLPRQLRHQHRHVDVVRSRDVSSRVLSQFFQRLVPDETQVIRVEDRSRREQDAGVEIGKDARMIDGSFAVRVSTKGDEFSRRGRRG